LGSKKEDRGGEGGDVPIIEDGGGAEEEAFRGELGSSEEYVISLKGVFKGKSAHPGTYKGRQKDWNGGRRMSWLR